MMVDDQLVLACLNAYYPGKYVIENGFVFLAAKSVRGIEEAKARSAATHLVLSNKQQQVVVTQQVINTYLFALKFEIRWLVT